jgi:hypothetical protein
MNDGKQNSAQSVSSAEQDPCLSGVVRSRDTRKKLHLLETKELSTYESVMILSRLLAPDAQDPCAESPAESPRQPAGSQSSYEMLGPAIGRAS